MYLFTAPFILLRRQQDTKITELLYLLRVFTAWWLIGRLLDGKQIRLMADTFQRLGAARRDSLPDQPRGNLKMNLAPLPGALSTQIFPPWTSITSLQR